MPKRGGDNSQISKENYDDNSIPLPKGSKIHLNASGTIRKFTFISSLFHLKKLNNTFNMAKRGNDNSQISKENYDDNSIRSAVRHGMTKASNEELKRRRMVNVSGNK